MTQPYCVMLVAAEASGDDRGASLGHALKARLGDRVRFVGVGGERMAEVGIQSPFNIQDLSIFGLLEGLLAYPRVLKRVQDTAALARTERPDLAVLIDSWGFTARVAKAIRDDDPGVKLVKYVGPQVWATRPGRARTAARLFDHMLTILSFDAPLFEVHGLATTFVGNSAINTDFSDADPQRLRSQLGLAPDVQILLVLPGSRSSEIKHLLPAFEQAVHALKATHPDLAIVIPVASTVSDQLRAAVAGWAHRVYLVEGETAKRDAMRAATVAMACSGTVTLELAQAGCPMVVAYRFGNLTHFILKQVITTRYAVLFNMAVDQFVAPELIQEDCTGARLAQEVSLRLDDATLRSLQVAAQFEALNKMGRGGPDPSEAAANVIVKMLEDLRV